MMPKEHVSQVLFKTRIQDIQEIQEIMIKKIPRVLGRKFQVETAKG